MELPTVELVCFDLDGTLCVRKRDDREILETVFDRVGIEPFFTVTDLRKSGVTLPADSDREAWERLFRRLGSAERPDDAARLAEATVSELTDDSQVVFRDGAEEALRAAGQHRDVALITNGDKEVQSAKLEALGIADAFDAKRYCGPGEHHAAKPDTEPFDWALSAFDVAATDAVHVGNSLEADVAGANAAGIWSVWTPTDRAAAVSDPAPDFRTPSLADVSNAL